MKFVSQLSHIEGHLRTAEVHGSLTDLEYNQWLELSPTEQAEYLLDVGRIVVTDYRINSVGDIVSTQWTQERVYTLADDPLSQGKKRYK